LDKGNILKGKKVSVGWLEGESSGVQNAILTGYLETARPKLEVVTISIRAEQSDEDVKKRAKAYETALENALRSGLTDVTLRPLPEIPISIPDDLPIIAYAKRTDPRDALLLPRGSHRPDRNRPMATTTMAKASQLKNLYPRVRFAIAKGSIRELLDRLDAHHYSGLVLPASTVTQAGYESRISRCFDPEELLPDPCQGILAVQGRAEEDYSYLEQFSDEATACEAVVERVFEDMVTRGWACAVSALSKVYNGELILRGRCFDRRRKAAFEGTERGRVEEAGAIGAALARRIRVDAGIDRENR
jgi:hydroxymethylbilane synthase